MGTKENDEAKTADAQRLAGNTNEIAEGDEVEAHAAVGFNTNETSVEDRPAEPQRLAANENEEQIDDSRNA